MKYIVLLLVLFLNNSVYANTNKIFNSYEELNTCIGKFENFKQYKTNLEKCLQSKEVEITNEVLSNLSDEKITTTDYVNLKDIPKIIKESPFYIYGVDTYLRSLPKTLLSNSDKNKLIVESYNNFNPKLVISSKNNSKDLSNAVLGFGAIFAIKKIITADNSKIVSLSTDVSSIAENSGSTVTITATLSDAVSTSTTVNLAISGTATASSDYSTIASSITIPAQATSASTTFTMIDDNISDVDETVIISISSVSGQGVSIGTSSATVTIIDDETVPSISLSASASTIAENSGSNITLTATSSIISSSNIVVSLASSGTATSGSDHGAISSITIPAGSTTATATFTPTDDALYDGGNETAIFDISSISGGSATENGTQQVTITITDNESAPTVTLSSSASTIAENSGSSVTLTATLSGGTDEEVTVSLSTSGTGTEGTDYGTISDITITAGSTTGTATLTPTDDAIYEGNETAIVNISGVSGGGATENGSQQTTISITDNESAPTVTLTSSSSTLDESSASTVTLTATLSTATTTNVTVSIGTSGTATEGTDYSTISNITILGGSTTGTSDFNIIDDAIYEGSETATIEISGVSGGSATENGTQTQTITITDNETAPTVTLSTNATHTAENSGGSLTLTATLSNATTANVTVNIGTSGTASEGTDYGTISDITVSAGSTTGTTSFTPTDDASSEGDETATVSITGVSGGSATEDGTQAVTITITDDETTPTVTLTSSTTSIAENSGSSITLTATLSTTSSSNVTVSFSTLGSATEGTDYGSLSSITINAGASSGTTSFTPTNDSIYEGNETATIDISSVSGGSAIENGTQQATLTITDDESAPTVSLSTSASSIAENAGSSVTLTATLSGATYQDVTVSISTSGTGTEGTDYATISDITISAGSTTGTSSFIPTDDSVYEGNETGIAAISAVSGGGATENGTQTQTITITDNESAPTVTLSTSASNTAENSGGSLTLTATLSTATTANVTVSIGTSGTASEGTDYGTISDITISAGSTTGTTSFTPSNDSSVEGNETATVSITGVSGGSATENGSQAVTITITDDDTTPTVTLTSSATSIAENSGSSITLTVTLSTADSSNVTVAFATSGTATEGTDYANISNMIILAGNTSGTVSFTPEDDNTVEGNETATIDISVSGGNAIENGTQQATLTITDNEVAPTVSLSSSATTIDEASGSSITLTARLSTTSDQTVTVGLTGSGTATAGSDYSSLSNITISAGATTGTTNFTPTSDTTYETTAGGTAESATIDITSVSGGSATENGTQQVIISITEKALNSGTQLTYNSANATTRKNLAEFANFNYNSSSEQNPFEIHNFHKAAGYGLTGSGKTVAIVDDGYDNDHVDLSDKTITTYGTVDQAVNNSVTDTHGLSVMGVIGADLGDGNLVGAAPNVNFHISSFNNLNGQTYINKHRANATTDAYNNNAIVQNNSWGSSNTVTMVKNLAALYSLTNRAAFSYYAHGTTLGYQAVQDYVDALNTFQTKGVIVWSHSNATLSNSGMYAALPELFSELEEAWITAVNIEIDGNAGSETYTLQSSGCGDTARYCMGGDGHNITLLADGDQYWTGGTASGTSFVAPQISAAVAILAEAFPNQTPEQWTDRLLASADNTWYASSGYSHDGYVDFANGVRHGYSNTVGHGILDVYAALQPITSSSYTASMRVANSEGRIINVPINISVIRSSGSFGDALINSLKNKQGYFYDALDGGFKYDLSSHALIKDNDTRSFKLESEFALLGKNFDKHKVNLQKGVKNSFTKVKDDQNFFATIHSSSLPIQSFTGEQTPNYLGFHSELAPYFNTKNNGVAIGGKMDTGPGSRILWGIATPMKQSGSETIGRNKLTSFSYENEEYGSYKNSIIFGIMEEDDTVLESELQGAFATENNTTITNFIGLSSEARITDKTLFRASASIGSSELNMDYSPMIKNTSKIISDNFSMNLSHELDDKNTTAVFSISQPNRITSGNMDIAISNLYDSEGNVTFENYNLSLVPTGRQIDIGLGLRQKVSENFEYIIKYKNSTNPGHVNDAVSTHNISAVSRLGNYKLGFTTGTTTDSDSVELKYSLDF